MEISTHACVLTIRPITASAIRVRCAKEAAVESPSLVLLPQPSAPAFKVSQDAEQRCGCDSEDEAVFDRHDEALHFTDSSGKTFLSEIAGTRRLDPPPIQGEATFAAEQAFVSPPGEHLFGTGEFQDGFLDVRDLPRRLTQVNSQIAIPFLLSSKGYGILWHNYGLTDLNPADERVVLTRTSTGKRNNGQCHHSRRRETRSPARGLNLPENLEVPRNGRYAFMLDVGQKMARRYHVEIDGKVVIDFANFWLPPTTSWFGDLSVRPPYHPGYRTRKMTIRSCFGGAPMTARYCDLL